MSSPLIISNGRTGQLGDGGLEVDSIESFSTGSVLVGAADESAVFCQVAVPGCSDNCNK